MMWLRSGRRRTWLVAVAVLAAVAGGCGGGGGSSGGAAPPGGGVGATVSPEPVVSEPVVWHPGLGRLDAPGGVFVDIAVSTLASCGVRAGGELVCWGEEDAEAASWGWVVRNAPVQWEFSRVELWSSAGSSAPDWNIEGDHACGLRSDGVVVCWGEGFSGLGDAVAVSVNEFGYPLVWELRADSDERGEGFVDIAAGAGGVCGLGAGGSVACWDGRRWVDAGVPGGLSGLVVGDGEVCGVGSGAGFGCWARVVSGEGSGLPGGVFSDVSAEAGGGCAIRAGGGQPVCWDRRSKVYEPVSARVDVPDDGFSEVAVTSGWYGIFGHGCGVKAGGGGEVVCWGDGADAPEGRFEQVVVAWSNSCGVRVGGIVVCWGNEDRSPAPFLGEVFTGAPAGGFAPVSAGRGHSCGIRTDLSAVCWGSSVFGQADAPPGEFTAVSAGALHSCGVRTDLSAVCWGQNGAGQADAPAGEFTAVSAGALHSCGVRTDLSAVCWGHNVHGTGAPAGEFTAVSAGGNHSCGIRTDLSAVCWDRDPDGQWDAPPGEFTAVSAGNLHSCGIRADLSAVCWGHNPHGQADAPLGEFTAVSAGNLHSCGIRADLSAVCWGHNPDGQWDAPLGEFAAVSAGDLHSCGIRADLSAVCWGHNPDGRADAPPDEFAAVSADALHSCAVRADLSAVCRGHNPDGRPRVAVGDMFVCGLRRDGAAICRGPRWEHVLAPDAGPQGAGGPDPSDPAAEAGLVEVSAYGDMVCGLRADGIAVCWFPGENRGPGEVPGGGYSSVLETWADLEEVPGGGYSSVSTSSLHGDGVVCGLRADRAVECWRHTADGPGWAAMAAPTAEFAALDARGPCGIVSATREIACWEHTVSARPPHSAGPLAAASVGGGRGCGIRSADRSLVCWHTHTQQPLDLGEGFAGEFSDVSVAPNGSGCAIRADHTLGCWGDFVALEGALSAPIAPPGGESTQMLDNFGRALDVAGPIAPPGGELAQVVVARHHACGIRTDGGAVCWGHEHDGAGARSRYFSEDDWMPTPLE
ncbi:hypothetical protein [Candidatus Poriferisocius sp.]|uniref:hypothetical protein n=1 Tax=Candidatus Poriferisocius sp. TaxID=3101276 RepID=UPI003B01481E